jgi:F0F1-type ATP synthase membrane subunit b/b'
MTVDPELCIVVSFAAFALVFAKKVYPLITQKLDDHIEEVKNKIHEAELLRQKACESLKEACSKKEDIQQIIMANRLKSEEKIKKLQKENEELLKQLRKRHEASIKMQLNAEFIKQKNLLIDRLSDLILEKLSEKVINSECEISTAIDKNDLRRLLDTHN